MKNKKGQSGARGSSFIIILIVSLSLMVMISQMVSEVVVKYGKSDIEEYSRYEKMYNDTQVLVDETIESEQGGVEVEEGERFEDSLFKKGWNTVSSVFKKAGAAVTGTISSINIFKDMVNYIASTSIGGIFVPSQINAMIISIILFLIIVALISMKMKWWV